MSLNTVHPIFAALLDDIENNMRVRPRPTAPRVADAEPDYPDSDELADLRECGYPPNCHTGD